MGNLTVKGVAALTAPGRYSDGDGLHLRIDSAGRKYWILRVQSDGKRRDVTIGSARRMTLAGARDAAGKVRATVVSGSPIVREVLAEVPTFAEAARATHKARAPTWKNSKHGAQWLSTLEDYAFPTLGEMRVDAVGRGDVHAALEPIWLEKQETAKRVMQRIDTVLRWAIGRGHRESTVDMSLVRDALPQQKRRVKHMAAVPWQDIPAFYRAIDGSSAGPLTRAALKWMILTVPRPGNVRLARLDQIDRDGPAWIIPPEDMKIERPEPHRIPLAPAALALLGIAEALSGGHWLFSPDSDAMSLDTMRMAMRRMGTDATPHGMRSSFKDWSLSAGWEDHLSEKQLAHVDKDKVRAAYARSDLLEERRPMMVAWAAFVTGS